MLIRKATSKDINCILNIWIRSGLPIRSKGRDNPANIEQQIKLQNLWFYVAEIESKLVGVILVTHDGRKGWINRLAVLPSYTRQGIASKLLEKAEQSLIDNNIGIFTALIEDVNESSRIFFEKQGYKSHEKIVYYSKRTFDSV